MNSYLKRFRAFISYLDLIQTKGRVKSIEGLSICASLPGARVGSQVEIFAQGRRIIGEVISFRGEDVIILPLEELKGVGVNDEVRVSHLPFLIQCGEGLLGRVLDGLGRPVDGKGELFSTEVWEVFRPSPSALLRRRIEEPIQVGVRAIDGFITIGEGQRIGLFAGPGVGKSTLLGQIAKGTDADVNIICLVGERGREVREFIEDSLAEEGLKKSVVIYATSDSSPSFRVKAAYISQAIAEYFRDKGRKVLLLFDSVTRFARALRDLGLAKGEVPTRQGYPASVFAELPRLLERAGTSDKGSITGIYTVLVSGDDMYEPIADEIRGILDGHIILDRKIAERGRWPAIDILKSLSRVMNNIVDSRHKEVAAWIRDLLEAYESSRDLIMVGAYQAGSDSRVDLAIKLIDQIESLLRQDKEEYTTLEQTREMMFSLRQGW